jgi:hypothetical protein
MKIVHDVFPAFVAVAPADTMEISELRSQPHSKGSYQLTKARVVITDERVIVAHDGPQGPVIVFSEGYEHFNKSEDKKLDSHVISLTGKMLAYRKDENCGCGSRLRAWNPYRHVYSTRDPQQ